MKKKRYAIIDVETTGGRPARDKITEIAIVLHDGEKILEQYSTLLNPERTIPYNIIRITGITDEMVKDAPKFYEVAKKIVEMTEGAIFVAHNVRFDYNFIREEFKRLGFTYTRKQLCTVRLSRKTMPGFRSYSLGNLIKRLGIKVDARHRALADTLATVTLFEKILAIEASNEQIDDMVNLGIKESKLPANLNLEKLHELPEECGVYYLHDLNGDVVYVGKSINIKKRVMEHFAKQTEKASKLQKLVNEITFELTGSELVALLYESYEIKRLKPRINRAQRNQHFPYAVITYTNEDGYICFDIKRNSKRVRKEFKIISEYPKIHSARSYLKKAIEEFELCHRHCNVEKTEAACFYYHVNLCQGACVGEESAADYNLRASDAEVMLSNYLSGNYFVIDKGRTSEEKAIILIEDGEYCGFGYIDTENNNGGIEDMKEAIKRFPNNPETVRIIRRFVESKKGVRVLAF